MKRLISVVLVFSCALFALAACSSGGTTTASSSQESSSSEPAKITNEEYITAVAQGLETRSTSTGTGTSTSTSKPSTGTSAGTGTGTTTSKPGVDATKKYQVGDRTDRLTGTVTKKTSDTYWVDGDDGIEYKCWPDDKKDLEFFAPGNKIEFSGVVRSTSKLSCNLEHTLWLGTK